MGRPHQRCECGPGRRPEYVVIDPTLEQRAHNDLNLTVASTGDLVAMIEAGGNEIDDDTMFNAIMAGHEENKKIVAFINGIVEEVGKPREELPVLRPGSGDPARDRGLLH